MKCQQKIIFECDTTKNIEDILENILKYCTHSFSRSMSRVISYKVLYCKQFDDNGFVSSGWGGEKNGEQRELIEE